MSSNVSDGGIHGQTNVGHWVRDAKTAQRYQAYWKLLSGDPGARAREQLTSMGFELLVMKNTWDNEEYRGINSRWLAPAAGLPFEVQFHTPESWTAKQQTHDAYEKINDLRTSAETRERLRAYQKHVSQQLDVPAGWQAIENYRKEGW